MMIACFFLMFAYGIRPSNVAYENKQLLDQLLRESTVYFKLRGLSGQIEVVFSHQFADWKRYSWFTAAAVVSICIIHLKGKNFGSDKPNHPEPLAYAIVEGWSPATDMLKDMLFQHCLDAGHHKGDVFFSINTVRTVKKTGTARVDNRKLLQHNMTEFLQKVAVLLGDDPSYRTLYCI